MTDKATDVTQADRDAAADFLKSDGHPFDRLWHPAVRRGDRDNHILVQAFARHRTASEQPASGEVADVVKFIDDFFKPWGSWKTLWWEGEVSDDAAFSADNALKHVANKLRALSTTSKASAQEDQQ